MRFALFITGSPTASQAPLSAYRFATALLDQGHELSRVFLHGDGVLLAAETAVYPSDEENIHHLWRQLIGEHKLDGVWMLALDQIGELEVVRDAPSAGQIP